MWSSVAINNNFLLGLFVEFVGASCWAFGFRSNFTDSIKLLFLCV